MYTLPWWPPAHKRGETRVTFPPRPCYLSLALSVHSPRPGTSVTSPSTQRGCGICSGSPSSNAGEGWLNLKATPFAPKSVLCNTLRALQNLQQVRIAFLDGQRTHLLCKVAFRGSGGLFFNCTVDDLIWTHPGSYKTCSHP